VKQFISVSLFKRNKSYKKSFLGIKGDERYVEVIAFGQGCQMVTFAYQNSHIGYILEGLGMESVSKFHGHLLHHITN
jgi:hypothetical protein